MKVALVADVHGNRAALAVVLAEAREAGVERLLVAGDLVGYYYDVAGVVALLDEWDWVGVRGNHEEMLGRWRRDDDRDAISARYGSALEVACAEVDPATLDRLEGMPHPLLVEVGGRTVRLCHGTPSDIDRYVYPDATTPTRDLLLDGDEPVDLVVYGHTHHPVVWSRNGTVVANPGSVGQPRDRIPGACWALWDTAANDVQPRRASYDMMPLLAECTRRDPDLSYLGDVLVRER